ncbi:hypothetical protein [[Mycoplasma] collis]|uniref:hypothetical protein n=1 Tax=[Mycoplasma] collis TaxID=2127 RepID=UPI00051C2CA4|nr:hypothetical protein [[Mycoplasma] collis]
MIKKKEIKKPENILEIETINNDNVKEKNEFYVIFNIDELDAKFIYLYSEKNENILPLHFENNEMKFITKYEDIDLALKVFFIAVKETEFYFENKPIKYEFSLPIEDEQEKMKLEQKINNYWNEINNLKEID